MSITTTVVCVVCKTLLEFYDERYLYIVENGEFGIDDVVCAACALNQNWQRCGCCNDLTPGADLYEDRWGGADVCPWCSQDCRGTTGCQVHEDRQRRTDTAMQKASDLSEVRDMLKRSSQWMAENKRPSEL